MTAPRGFLEAPQERADPQAAVLLRVVYAIDNTTKIRAVFEIDKGVNKHPDKITVNGMMAHEDRRVPFEHMIYIADGPSDVPVFSVVGQYGGRTLAVYNPEARQEMDFRQALGLHEQGRVQVFGPADYCEGSHTERCLSVWFGRSPRTSRRAGSADSASRPASRPSTSCRTAVGAAAPVVGGGAPARPPWREPAPPDAPGDSGDPRPAFPEDAKANVGDSTP